MITKINGFNNHFKPSFGLGKVELYSDFDHTYCPISHADMHYSTPDTKPEFVQYCDSFQRFFDKTKDGLKFHITSGRTFGEYQAVSTLIKNQGFKLPLPDTFIAKNGSDEYIKTGSDADFYDNKAFPFSYDVVNQEKEADIKAKTGWDGEKIKSKLKEMLKKYNFRIVEADSENGVKDYGDKSLFFNGGLPDERNVVYHGTDKPQWVVGLRNDGHCKIFISYPPDMKTTPERKAALKDIQKQVDSLDFKRFRSVTQDKKGKQRVNEVLEPLVEGVGDSKHGLTKLYDTKEAVKRAKADNDLVIVAGDDDNDFNMLNPLNYITPSEEALKDELLADWGKIKNHPAELAEKLDENNPAHREIIDAVNNLPFVGIAVNSGKNDGIIKELTSAFGEKSRMNKIITVETAQLKDGIKQAVKLYSSQNPEYRAKLNSDVEKEIYGEKKVEEPFEDTFGEDDEKPKKKGSAGPIATVIAAAIIGLVFLINKHKEKKESKTSVQKTSTPKISTDTKLKAQKL